VEALDGGRKLLVVLERLVLHDKGSAAGAPPSRGRDNDQEGFRVDGREQMPTVPLMALVQGPHGLGSETRRTLWGDL
jgi:hypothetical protein